MANEIAESIYCISTSDLTTIFDLTNMKVLGIVIAVLVAVASGGYARRVRTFGRRDSPIRYGAGQTFKDVVELLEGKYTNKYKVMLYFKQV